MRLIVLLLALFLVGCNKDNLFAEFQCDLNEEPRLAQVAEFDALLANSYVGNPGDELYKCLPSGAYTYVSDYYRVVKSVKIKNIKKGDTVIFFIENQFTNEEEFEHSLVTYVTLADGPLKVEGKQVADAVGDNILGRNTQHHMVVSRTGAFVAKSNMDEVYLNYVAYAAHGYGQHGVGPSGIVIDVSYGQTSLIILRGLL